jgi:alpha-amylase/alpha-mannosidase (GH57 family)
MSGRLKVVFLWHMHQPTYRNAVTGGYDLPWTYLHAVKDYYDMAAIVERTEGARAVFNLVPSLLEQIGDYASGAAEDPFLIHGRMDPAVMSAEQRRFITSNFFSANRERMIEPYPRYLELLYLAGNGSANSGAGYGRNNFGDREILDLQVWFFLAWTGEEARRRFPGLGYLLKKGRDFTLEDKQLLFDIHGEILKGIVPLYAELHLQGKAELSVSPYFHPILPLLCDTGSAATAMPRINLPSRRFSHPEDARAQVAGAIDYFKGLFGFAPAGMWPSEGSVSDDTLSQLVQCGVKWAASDEGILSASLPGGLGDGRENLYHPWKFDCAGGGISLLFRDRVLSDLIGFTYTRWDADRAVDDFIRRLKGIREGLPGKTGVVSVILDGENAWEYYQRNGNDFLTAIYRKIAADDALEMVTASEAVEHSSSRRVISHIHPGSWINANFGIWIGHPEENAGWDLLEATRQAAMDANRDVAGLLAAGNGKSLTAQPENKGGIAREICRCLFAAEGSDWFWWFGDDHFSPHSNIFDDLFRNNLIQVYRLLGLDVPPSLFEPIKRITPAGLIRTPATFVSPVINGTVDDYFEWLGAGLFDLSRQSSSMHAGECLLRCFFYGYDHEFLYFRFDGCTHMDKVLQAEDVLRLHLILDREYLLPITVTAEKAELLARKQAGWKGTGIFCRWGIARVCETGIPLGILKPPKHSTIYVYLTLTRGQDEIGRWPTHMPLALNYVGPELELDSWLV